MQVILSDHNCEGQASAIFDILLYDGTWLELVPMQLKWFQHKYRGVTRLYLP